MKSENIFSTTRDHFETAFNNYEHFQKQNEKMFEIFVEQLEKGNQSLDKLYSEWQADTNKAFQDYRELFLKGLDYLAGILEKHTKSPHSIGTGTKIKAA
ncbi:MAG: hypothetical protein JRH15_13605 [Deltaproteobacteria bacterium]|nr:hypothetical protein [Deltaproteobacteria bacterium]